MNVTINKAIEKRAESSGNLVAFDVHGSVTVEDIKAIHEDLKMLLDRHRKLKLLVNIQFFEGIEPLAVLEDLKFTMHYLNDFSAMAVVGNEKWQKVLTNFTDKLTEYKISFFNSDRLRQAFKWLEEQK